MKELDVKKFIADVIRVGGEWQKEDNAALTITTLFEIGLERQGMEWKDNKIQVVRKDFLWYQCVRDYSSDIYGLVFQKDKVYRAWKEDNTQWIEDERQKSVVFEPFSVLFRAISEEEATQIDLVSFEDKQIPANSAKSCKFRVGDKVINYKEGLEGIVTNEDNGMGWIAISLQNSIQKAPYVVTSDNYSDWEIAERKHYKFRIGEKIKGRLTGDIVSITDICYDGYRTSDGGLIAFEREDMWDSLSPSHEFTIFEEIVKKWMGFDIITPNEADTAMIHKAADEILSYARDAVFANEMDKKYHDGYEAGENYVLEVLESIMEDKELDVEETYDKIYATIKQLKK